MATMTKKRPKGQPEKAGSRQEHRAKVNAELLGVARRNGGLIPAPAVVEMAEDVRSALHQEFIWDDRKAAYEYRLETARKLIRTYFVVTEENGDRHRVRGYVSLTTDRGTNGYRSIESVMSDREMRAQLLADALADLERFQIKYQALKELSVVFEAMAKVKKPRTPRRKKK